MNTLIQELLTNKQSEKIQKPNFQTRQGREFLAFYLRTKLKQILNHDKKAQKQMFLSIKEDFLERFLDRLVNFPDKKIIIGITGETASGKSTICTEIKKCIKQLNLPITILNADNYFKDISELIKKYGDFDSLREHGYDVDAPDNFQLDILKHDIINLAQNKDVMAPQYVVNGAGISIPNAIKIQSNKIVVVEGMATMYGNIKDLFDIKVFVDINTKIRKKRFLERAKTRNQDHQNALKHWEYVLEAGKKYILPAKDECDIIANGECDLDYFTKMLVYINLVTNNFCENCI